MVVLKVTFKTWWLDFQGYVYIYIYYIHTTPILPCAVVCISFVGTVVNFCISVGCLFLGNQVFFWGMVLSEQTSRKLGPLGNEVFETYIGILHSLPRWILRVISLKKARFFYLTM